MQRSWLTSVNWVTFVEGSPNLQDGITIPVETSFNHMNDLTRPPELRMKLISVVPQMDFALWIQQEHPVKFASAWLWLLLIKSLSK